MSILSNIIKKAGDTLPNSGRELGIFAIKDEKTEEFHPPFFQTTAASALRLFKTEINRADPNNQAYLYPEDFSLYYLGTFNQGNGKIEPACELLVKGPATKESR